MTVSAYLDWNATAPLRPEALAAFGAAQAAGGNASSVHAAGRAARRAIEDARAEVAALAGAEPGDVVFTSGGTEANALALSPALGGRLFVSAIEHPSVLAGGRFSETAVFPVLPDGTADLACLERMLRGEPRPLVSLMLANNETGAVQPVARAAEIVHAAGGLLHVDAVQGPGRIACDIGSLGADLLTLSAHKIGGPQGAGALIRRGGIAPEPLLRGGGQERGQRAGTENVAALAGFGAAAAAVRESWREEAARMAVLRERLEQGILHVAPETTIFCRGVERLPNTTLFSAPGMKAETAVIAFDLEGVAVSSGAACSSGKVAPSHVLEAMGAGADVARGAVRVSLGPRTGEAEVERFLKAWEKLAENLYKSRKHREIAA